MRLWMQSEWGSDRYGTKNLAVFTKQLQLASSYVDNGPQPNRDSFKFETFNQPMERVRRCDGAA